MKTRSGRLGDFIMTLFVLVMGGGLLYGNLVNVAVGQAIGDALAMPMVGAAVGTVLILSVLLRCVGGCRREKNRFINFDSQDGSVGISTKAIEDFIKRVGREFTAIKNIETRLFHSRRALDISMNVKVHAGNRIPELSQLLQQRIRESVRESLGLEEIRNITINVQEIIGDPIKSTQQEADQIGE